MHFFDTNFFSFNFGWLTNLETGLNNQNPSQLELFIYLIFLIIFYILCTVLKNFILKFVKDPDQKNQVKNYASWIVFVATIMVGILVFSRYGSTILAVSGIFSAALVVALQDFVSSFVAWIFIMSRGKYRVGDIIKIAGNRSYIFGRVTRIEVFRTLMDELKGDDTLGETFNKERPTGRTVSIPNNLIMKGAVINSTLQNKIVWQDFDVTITLDTDFLKTEEVLQAVLAKIFDSEYYKKYAIPKSYLPKLTLYIGSNGIIFSIWFPAPVSRFREVLDPLCKQILIEFSKNRIELAYNTLTIETKKV